MYFSAASEMQQRGRRLSGHNDGCLPICNEQHERAEVEPQPQRAEPLHSRRPRLDRADNAGTHSDPDAQLPARHRIPKYCMFWKVPYWWCFLIRVNLNKQTFNTRRSHTSCALKSYERSFLLPPLGSGGNNGDPVSVHDRGWASVHPRFWRPLYNFIFDVWCFLRYY